MTNRNNRDAWLTPYQGGVSTFDEDRNRGNGLPSALSTDSYNRIAQRLEDRRMRQQRWAGVITGQPGQQPQPQPGPPPAGQRRTAAAQDGMRRFASVEEIPAAGFKRLAAGMYKQGHDIWELRQAEDGEGYCLVRKREERAVDLRQMAQVAGPGTAAAMASGMVRGAHVQPQVVGCPSCGSRIDFQMTAANQGLAWCSESARGLWARAASQPTRGGVPCHFQSGIAARMQNGSIDLLVRQNGGYARVGQIAPPIAPPAPPSAPGGGMPMPQTGDPIDDMLADAPIPTVDDGPPDMDMGGEPGAIGEDEFLDDQGQMLFDQHEVMHGREPVFDPESPEIMNMQQVVDQAGGGEGGGEDMSPELDDASTPSDSGDEGDDSGGDDSEGAGAPPFGDAASAPPPPAGASKEAGCKMADHGKPGHKCAMRRAASRRSKYKGKKILAVRKGGVAEGIIIKIMPMDGDMMADFGEGEESIPLDMVLDPQLGPIDENDPAVDMKSSGEDDGFLHEVESDTHFDESPKHRHKDREAKVILVTAEDVL